MKFYSENMNQIVVANGKIVAEFNVGEFETTDKEAIKILKLGGYKHDKEDHEIETETIRLDEKNDDAGESGEKRVYKTEKVKSKNKGRPKKG